VKLSELGEFGFIDRIRESVPSSRDVKVGIGDDCAATVVPSGHLLLTTNDLLIEGVHFRREWTDIRLLGRKSVSVNISDIAAMGGTPTTLFLGLGIPPGLPVEELQLFMEGFLEAATEHGAHLAGGDTCRSPNALYISVTAHGTVPEGEIIRRNGAAPGDAIYVTGTLGDSALALKALGASLPPEPYLAQRHHDPTPRTALGKALGRAALPTAMIDISDGLLADLQHILDASGVGGIVEEEFLPLSPPFIRSLNEAPELIDLALSGGEDYELLFTAPQNKTTLVSELAEKEGIRITRIGSIVTSEDGLTVKTRNGILRSIESKGFNHFDDTPKTG